MKVSCPSPFTQPLLPFALIRYEFVELLRLRSAYNREAVILTQIEQASECNCVDELDCSNLSLKNLPDQQPAG
jgi:hypothetical protein